MLIILSQLVGQGLRPVDPNDIDNWIDYPLERQDDWIYGPVGAYPPSSTVKVRVTQTFSQGTIYYKLIQTEPELEIIAEETHQLNETTSEAYTWTVELPDEVNRTYVIGAMYYFMNWTAGWVDTVHTRVEWLEAKGYLDKNRYRYWENPILIIESLSEYEILTGSDFKVEKFVNGVWVKVPFKKGTVWLDILYSIMPGKSGRIKLDFQYYLGDLNRGRYRVSKEFYPPDSGLRSKLVIEFWVEDSPPREYLWWAIPLILLVVVIYVLRKIR